MQQPLLVWEVAVLLYQCEHHQHKVVRTIDKQLFINQTRINMQRIFNSLLGLSLAVMVIFSTGCGEDGPGGGTTPLAPTIFLASGVDLVSTDASVPFANGSFSVRVDVNDGDNTLNTLTITEAGTTIPAANLEFDAGATIAQNPFLILGADQSGTTYDIKITPTGLMANETRLYEFTVADSEGQTAVFSVNVTFAATAPTLTVTGPANAVSTSSTGFTVNVEAMETDFAIDQISFSTGGTLLNPDNVIVLGGFNDPLTTNPENISATNGAYNQAFEIRPVSPVDGETRVYTIEVADNQGTTSTATVSVTFATPQVDVITGVLLNAAGPQGTGGLDLDNGVGTGSNDPAAEIKDQGIDLGAPSNAENWIQRIAGANDATLVSLNDGNAPDGFNFDNVVAYDEVTAAYNAGASVTQSDVVAVGDIYGVLRAGKYYLIRVDVITVTENDNDDSYEMSIIKESN